MSKMTFLRKMTATAAAAVVGFGISTSAAMAGVIPLGFIIDDSGSIGSGAYATIKQGLHDAIDTLIPTNSTYELTVISFASGTQTLVNRVLIDSVATRAAAADAVLADGFTSGTTNMTGAFNAMNSVLTGTSLEIDASYVNLATDGVANNETNAIAARNNLIGTGVGQAGVDNISIEAIGGGVDVTFLQNDICYPGLCTVLPVVNFPSQGFYIAVPDADGYADAIGNKIQIVTNQLPEPGTMAMFGLGVLGMGFARRRKAAA
jgi:uncharacterized protein YegL